MENTLVPFDNFLTNKGSFNIPPKRKNLLFFSIQKPKNVGFSVGISLSFNISLDDNPFTEDNLRAEVEKLKVESISNDDILKIIKEKIRIDLNCGKTQSEEPSLIYLLLPVIKPANVDGVDNPNYYPCYAQLSPEQRWIYLNWLQDISKPIPKGYVYIYFYGLERRVLQEANIDAIDELLFLSECHNFIKREAYSAILFAYFRSSNEEILKKLFKKNLDFPINNLILILYYSLKKSLTSKDIFELMSQNGSINKRYINLHPQLYLEELDKYLLRVYKEPCYPFYQLYSINEFPLEKVNIFLNYSLPDEIREVEIYNIANYHKFVNDVTNIHKIVHEEIKIRLKKNKSK
jgi:hypothetical protein